LVEAGPDAPATMMQTSMVQGSLHKLCSPITTLPFGLEHLRRNEVRSAGQMLEAIRQKADSMRQARTSAIAASRYSQGSQADIDSISVIEKMLAAALEFASGELR
jgi:hypothetical protein